MPKLQRAVWILTLAFSLEAGDAQLLRSQEPAQTSSPTAADKSSNNDKISLADAAPELYYQLRRYSKFYGDPNTNRGGLLERSQLLGSVGGARDFLVDHGLYLDVSVTQFLQGVREMLAEYPNITLNDIDLINLPVGPVIMVTIQGPRTPLPSKVRWAEKVIQDRVGDPRVRLVVRTIESSELSSTGLVLFGEAHFGLRSAEEIALQQKIEQQVKREIEKILNLFVPNADAVKRAQGWVVRAEVAGPRAPDPKELQAVNSSMNVLSSR